MNNKKFSIIFILLSFLLVIFLFLFIAPIFDFLITLALGIILFFIVLGIATGLHSYLNDDESRDEFKEIYDKPPNNDPPALINFLFGSKIIVNEINIGSFYLTLLDLINRKYVSVKIISKFDSKNEKTLDKIILKINTHSTDKLHPFEKNVLKCIYVLKYKGNINILDTKNTLRKRLKVNTFQKNYDAWMKNFYNECLKNNKFNSFSSSRLARMLGIARGNKEGEELKMKWNLFKKYYNKNFQSSNKSEKFLNEGINHIPYLLALGLPKTTLINNFSQATDITDTFLFLKYGTDSLIKDIIVDFLHADGSFDPKYYNTSGNFVPGYG